MKNLFLIFVTLLLTSCFCNKTVDKKVEKNLGPRDYTIYYEGLNDDGRATYTVVFSNGKEWKSAYAEEIGNFLKSGIIEYDKCFIISRKCEE
jgi:hypothetical protein